MFKTSQTVHKTIMFLTAVNIKYDILNKNLKNPNAIYFPIN